MIARFEPLLSLEVWHEYHGGPCPEVGFLIPQPTAAVLRGAGLWAKPAAGQLRVAYHRDDGAGAPVRSAAGKRLRIGLAVRDPSFANVTAGFDPAAGALCYRNEAAAAALDAAPTRLDLRAADPELWREGAFAMVELAVAQSFYAAAPAFQIRFAARGEPLRYYVVARGFSSVDLDQLAVQDQTPGAAGGPDEVRFDRIAPAQLTADERARADTLAADGARVLLFRSAAPVARRARSPRQIQLTRGAEPVIERLPQPGKDRGTSDLIVHLSKTKS